MEKPILKTPASFMFKSLGQDFAFNAASRAKLRAAGAVSKVPQGLLRQYGEQFYNGALQSIELNEKTPLCLALERRGCNKSIAHNYTHFYHQLLDRIREKDVVFCEIGLGTNNQDVPSMMSANYRPGASIRGWSDYFSARTGPVYGFDVDERVMFHEDGIQTAYFDQTDPSAILATMRATGLLESGIDVFLDDGLHTFDGNFIALCCVWPLIKKNGLYLIEDMAQSVFESLVRALQRANFQADLLAIELPSAIKSDNRVLALQKYG